MRHLPALLKLLLFSSLLALATQTALAQSTAFTYQGRLTDGGAPSDGSYELEFKLFDAATGGTQQPQPTPLTVQFTGAQAVAVVNGLFTVQLDFGASAFPGAARYLEVGVRKAGDSTFTTLAPRQPISSTPYAIRSASAATAADFSGSLAGDVTGTQAATVVNSVGGQSAANVASGAAAANSATDGNTAGAIVKRDASGNFSAGVITATLSGNASTATTATSATNFSGSLSGEVTGTQSATVVSSVGGTSAANVASGASSANAATDSNSAGTIVKRDASGNFSAGTITASLNGNASTATTATNFGGSLSGDVTGTQSATVVASVGGTSAANVASGAGAANAATADNTAGAIVKRDASGNFSAGTITAALNGNAATATAADTATTATTASGVSASAGDSVVTAINASSSTVNAARLPSTLATQNGSNTFSGTNTFSTSPTFSAGLSAGGQRVTSVATPTDDSDAATKAYVDASAGAGGTAGGHLSGTYPNPSIATTASAGTNIVAAVNASSASVTTAHVAGDVELLTADTQTATLADGEENDLIDVQLNGGNNTNLGQSGTRDLLSLRVNGTFNISGFPHARDMERFRVDNAGGILSVAGSEEFEGSIPMEGSGGRFMWYPGKRAIRAGYINGTQWDDANIGLYSAAFGYNARASGDYGFAAGKDVVAANSWSIALGQYVTSTGAAGVAMGYYAHGNSRQGSFVFSDRSVLDDDNIATDESFKAANNHTFNVRATGGYYFYTNTGVSTGLRLSHLTSSNVSYGSFVWTDRSSDSSITPTAQNQTIFRADGGYWLYSNSSATAGVTLAPGSGSWTSISDRNMKANLAAVNPRAILRGVLSLPISTWNYKTQDASIRHIGPMAQDFYAAFKVGEGDKTITSVDPDGVAFAAIQGLHEELKDRDAQIEGLKHQVKEQQTQLDALKKLLCLDHPEAAVCKESK